MRDIKIIPMLLLLCSLSGCWQGEACGFRESIPIRLDNFKLEELDSLYVETTDANGLKIKYLRVNIAVIEGPLETISLSLSLKKVKLSSVVISVSANKKYFIDSLFYQTFECNNGSFKKPDLYEDIVMLRYNGVFEKITPTYHLILKK